MQNRSGWQYTTAGLFIAGIAAVISYNDGLFVARLAGNHDRQAFLYPLLAPAGSLPPAPAGALNGHGAARG